MSFRRFQALVAGIKRTLVIVTATYLTSLLVISTIRTPAISHLDRHFRTEHQRILSTSVKNDDRPSVPSIANGGNLNFNDWITNAGQDIYPAEDLIVDGTIPSYVSGSLVRNGPSIWDTSDEYYGHMFDGLGRIVKYDIHDGKVSHSARVLKGVAAESIVEEDEILKSLSVGPIIDGKDDEPIRVFPFNIFRFMFNYFTYDNTPVSIWDHGDILPSAKTEEESTGKEESSSGSRTLWATTDAPFTTQFDLDTLETLERRSRNSFFGVRNSLNWFRYEFFGISHAQYCKRGSGATYNLYSDVTLGGLKITLIREEDAKTTRTIIAQTSLPDGGLTYLHSFATTPKRALVVLTSHRYPIFDFASPLSDIISVFNNGFLRSLKDSQQAYLWVVNLDDQSDSKLVELPEELYNYHTISATDELDSSHSSVRVIGYSRPDYISGEDHFFRMDRHRSAEGRNQIPRFGRILEIRTDGSLLWARPDVAEGFELPVTRYSYTRNGNGPWNDGKHPRYIYAPTSYADGATFDSWGLLKVDTESMSSQDTSNGNLVTLPTLLHRETSHYYGEPTFVPDPEGKEEDDGVILSQVYDGNRRESYLLVLDAKTFTPLAKAYTGQRNTFDFHGAFFPFNR